MDAIAILIAIVSTFAAFGVAAVKRGVDSRDFGPRAQI